MKCEWNSRCFVVVEQIVVQAKWKGERCFVVEYWGLSCTKRTKTSAHVSCMCVYHRVKSWRVKRARTKSEGHRQVVQCKAACIKVQSTNQSTIKEFIFYEHMHGNYTTRFSANQMDAPCCVQLDFGTHNANHSSKDNISSPFSFSIPWTTV